MGCPAFDWVVLLVLARCVYAAALGYGFVSYDDNIYRLRQPDGHAGPVLGRRAQAVGSLRARQIEPKAESLLRAALVP
jgi:hypothetical protein